MKRERFNNYFPEREKDYSVGQRPMDKLSHTSSRDRANEFLSRGKGGVAYWHRAIALCYIIFALQANEPVGTINIFCRLKAKKPLRAWRLSVTILLIQTRILKNKIEIKNKLFDFPSFASCPSW